MWEELLERFWTHLVARPSGPLSFRFLVQPAMSILLAVRAGIRDSKAGKPAYLWAVFTNKEQRRALIKDGWKDIARIFLLSSILDVGFQLIIFRWIYPGETLVIASALACLPYALVRGPTSRLCRFAQDGQRGLGIARSKGMRLKNIEFTRLGKCGFNVSRVCLGTWAFGGTEWGGAEDEASIKTIRTALDQGLNFVDTAPVYGFGRSEEVVGQALKAHGNRAQVIVSTKVGLEWNDKGEVRRNSSRERILEEVENSLKRLQTDYIDLYFNHYPDPLVPIEETARMMGELLKSGKIRAIGVSNYSTEQIRSFEAVTPIHVIQPPYNLFERQAEKDVLPHAKRNGIAVMGYGALCRGLLTGTMKSDTKFPGDDLRNRDPKFVQPRYAQYLAAVDALGRLAHDRHQRNVLALAIRWVIDRGVIALWGARHPPELDPLEQVFGWSLSEADFKDIDALLTKLIRDPVGPDFFAPPARETTPTSKAA